MPSQDVLLSGAVLVVAVGILVTVRRLRADFRAQNGVDSERLSAAISETWRDMEFDRTETRLSGIESGRCTTHSRSQ